MTVFQRKLKITWSKFNYKAFIGGKMWIVVKNGVVFALFYGWKNFANARGVVNVHNLHNIFYAAFYSLP